MEIIEKKQYVKPEIEIVEIIIEESIAQSGDVQGFGSDDELGW